MKKAVLITGCSSGIGLATARLLQTQGYQVFATARHLTSVQQLQEQGFTSCQLDVNDSNSIHTALEKILQQTQGNLYALINNAGYAQPGALEDLSRELFRQQFETNVFGLQELTNCVLPIMRAQGYGRIIHLSSVLGHIALPYRGAYNASKFAVEGLADTLRLELQGTQIFVSLITPGPISSNFRQNAFSHFINSPQNAKSAHLANYQKLQKNFLTAAQTQPFILPPERVAEKILQALQSAKPKIHYYVTVPAYLFKLLKRILPTVALDWILKQVAQREINHL